MEDRRRFERFEIALPARMVTVSSGKKHVFEFKTRNISATGAFIDTDSPFSEGTRFKIDLTVSIERIKALTGAMSLIECEGCVVRATPTGIAICFDTDCQIWSLKNSNSYDVVIQGSKW